MKFHKNPSVGSLAVLRRQMDITRLVVTTYFEMHLKVNSRESVCGPNWIRMELHGKYLV
jgi:hypothetical protein